MCVNINRNSSYEMNTTHQTQQTEENVYVKMFRKNAVIPDNTYMQEYTAHWNPFFVFYDEKVIRVFVANAIKMHKYSWKSFECIFN